MKWLRITRCNQLKVGVKWNRRSPGGHRRHNCKISFLWTGMLFHCSICITVWLKKYMHYWPTGVKMAGYLAKFFCVFLWTMTKLQSIKTRKKKKEQGISSSHPAISTKQAWSIKDALLRGLFMFSLLWLSSAAFWFSIANNIKKL